MSQNKEDTKNTGKYRLVGSVHSIWFVLARSALLCAPPSSSWSSLTEEAIQGLVHSHPGFTVVGTSTETLFYQCHTKVSWNGFGRSISFQRGLPQSLLAHNCPQTPSIMVESTHCIMPANLAGQEFRRARGHACLASAL